MIDFLFFAPFRVRLAVWLRFGSVSAPFRVRFGVLGGRGEGLLSVRAKNITTRASDSSMRDRSTETKIQHEREKRQMNEQLPVLCQRDGELWASIPHPAPLIGGPNLFTNAMRRGPPQIPGRLFGLYVSFPSFS